MNYKLKTTEDNSEGKQPIWAAFIKIASLLAYEKKNIAISLVAILVNSGMTLLGPLIVGYTIDQYVENKDYHGVLVFSGILLVIYVIAFCAGYVQTRVMGAVGQRTLFRLRNTVFTKLQELPVAFFNQNKAGDLISRINNDTARLNSFFSQTLMQFTGSAFTIVGAGIFILVINWRLGLAALVPAVFLMILTRATSSWIKKINLRDARAEGALSSEIQESLENFKVILAFNRRDYFKEKFAAANDVNFRMSIIAGLGNNIFSPIYDFASNLAQLTVLIYGIYLIAQGHLAIGLLVSFLLYIGRFYDPLRQFASFWSTLQIALAGWERISEITNLESDLTILPADATEIIDKKTSGKVVATANRSIMRFEKVSFRYPGDGDSDGKENAGKEVLRDVSFNLDKGKTYALVGPTGGGKTTTASLIARLFDPTSGLICLNGKDIRSYTPAERTQKIGFILQEPFLFSGSVKDNIIYGNPKYEKPNGKVSATELSEILKKDGLEKLLERFENGLDTNIAGNADTLSLGQRQLIAFMRAVLRNPELLILDEATANIDTVTEQLLEEILRKLPKETTKVIIAHRLNTIESADEIFFVNGGTITPAGSMEHAVDMLLHNKRSS
jgi:ATP-binding cassette subfamily B protein